ncbi:putative lipid II flippase FtsW [uncultured Cellulomonas sp.]|uniref:putative lipid II flippase FtsW n=1 Tax=uncultured Cellulomonas sp. TaxID=189682 RepID=UPI002616C60E|nr:putative lipid II flippase FtsW [uncultured Cellulomonas sp.]
MTQTTGYRPASSARAAASTPVTDAAATTGRTPGGTRRDVAAALGLWNSSVTSYYLLTGATTILLVLGLVMVLSSSSVESLADEKSPYAEFLKQAQFAIVGLPVLWVMSRMSVPVLKKLAWPMLLGAGGLQLLVFTPLGLGAGGNKNWIGVGPVTMQPSEVVKLALALWIGAVLARKHALLGDWKHSVIPVLPVAGAMVGLVLLGHDLGTALIIMLLVGGALFMAGVPLRIFAVAGALTAAAVVALVTTSANRMTRITCLFTGTCDPTDEGYQTLHGTWGLATGGWWGVGLGASREKWSYLPEAHNDFIFAIIGEELGLVGTLLVLALFALLGLAMSRIIRRHPDPFVVITTGGISVWIVGQALVNIGVVIGLLPVIGVPLPLVSAGGSALIMTMAAIGVLISFARQEPGAAEALAARPGVVRRSLAVLGRTRGARR